VILLSGFGTLETAIEAVKEGAFDFLSKPWNNEELKALVRRALDARETKRPTQPAAPPKARRSLMIGSSPRMMQVYKTIASLQASKATVLITGESGTGKELVARSIHLSSDRKDKPFVAVNCGALTETLLESELFGHVKGSFTGAAGDKKGLFEEADGGTIFLDEIGETTPNFQVRLLRVLQEHEIRRVGAGKTLQVDVRVIAATNKDLQVMVKAGTFREDLYYRLSVVELGVPALRERREDIPKLLDHFLAEFSNGKPCVLHSEALRVLEAYSWPGNVRELANVVENLTQLNRGREIGVDSLPAKIQADVLKKALRAPAPGAEDSGLIADWPSLEELERRYIRILVGQHKEKQRIAEILGVDRTTLYRKLKRYGFQEGGEEGGA
jgi:DNA-binding NtrC family response regulator